MFLKVVNLSKRYKDRWVLRDISLEIAGGEIFGIGGLAGSGKTSLVRTIAGLVPGNGGSVIVNNDEIAASERRRWWLSGDSTDESFWKRIFRLERGGSSRAQTAGLIERLGRRADLVILDDPFKNIDTASHDQLRDEIARRRDGDFGTIVTSANFEDLAPLCDRVLILAQTEVAQIGTPHELYEQPCSAAVALATGRCNLFSARRLSSSKTEVPEFHTIDGGHRIFAQNVGLSALGAINQNVHLGIRPEHISISFGASFPEDNLLRATITAVRFLGPTTLIDLDCGGLNLQALVLRLVGLAIGDECVVGLPPDRVHVFRR